MKLTHRAISLLLSCLWHLGQRKQSRDDITPLAKSLLRKFPFWREGHLILAEESLKRGAVGTAYASAQCIRMLNGDTPHTKGLYHFIVGSCFLRRGDWSSALNNLREARKLLPNDYRVMEEQSAALMLAGEYEQALETLSAIPVHALSAEAKAASAFARSKLKIHQ